MNYKSLIGSILSSTYYVVRWLIAFVDLIFVLILVYLFFVYPFSWLLIISTALNLYLYILFMLVTSLIIIWLETVLAEVVSYYYQFSFIQTKIYAIIIFISLAALVGYFIYAAWSDNINLTWEYLRYSVINKIIFTLLVTGILHIPWHLYRSALEE